MNTFFAPAGRRLTIAGSVLVVVLFAGAASVRRASGQAVTERTVKRQTASEAFKNVTTASLKELPVDDFIGTMGVISADLGLDCADCHPNAGSDKVDWVFDTARKKTTRRMIDMVALINRTSFGGTQLVTCYTCHHGRLRPAATIALDALYGPPNDERDEVLARVGDSSEATQILEKYIRALGPSERLSSLKSYIATGTSVGYEGLGGGGQLQIAVKFPDQRMVRTDFRDHPERGNSLRTYNGHAGWIRSPRALLRDYEPTGVELDGMRLDALLSFPSQIGSVLTGLRVGGSDNIDGIEVDVIQGRGLRGMIATLYFEKESGLLKRIIRYASSPVGRIPTQFDYADYRVVDGVKFPFKIKLSWLDGRENYELTQVKTNVEIAAATFDKP